MTTKKPLDSTVRKLLRLQKEPQDLYASCLEILSQDNSRDHSQGDFFFVGKVLHDLGYYKKALLSYDHALARGYDKVMSSLIHSERGRCYQQLGFEAQGESPLDAQNYFASAKRSFMKSCAQGDASLLTILNLIDVSVRARRAEDYDFAKELIRKYQGKLEKERPHQFKAFLASFN